MGSGDASGVDGVDISSAYTTGGNVGVKVDGGKDGCSVGGTEVADAGGWAGSGTVSSSRAGEYASATGVSGAYV